MHRAIQKIPYEKLTAIIYLIALFVDLSDSYIVNIAIPSIQNAFHLPSSLASWILTSYLISFAAVIPASGWLGDRFGTKKIFLVALCLYAIGAILSSLSNSFYLLIVCRIIQGIGGGMLVPVGQAIMFRAFPKERLAKVLALIAFFALLGPSIGSIIGGSIVSIFGWRLIYLINVIPVIICIILAKIYIKEDRQVIPGSFDLLGTILSISFLIVFLIFLSYLGSKNNLLTTIITLFSASIVFLVGFIYHQCKVKHPLLDLKLFLMVEFRICQAVIFLALISGMGSLFLMSLYLQDAYSLSALKAGIVSAPFPVGLLIMFLFVRKILNKLGARAIILIGLLFYSIFTFLLIIFNPFANTFSFIVFELIMFLRGLAFGLINVPLQVTAFQKISNEKMGRASSIWNTCRCLSNVIGVSLFGLSLNFYPSSQFSCFNSTITGNYTFSIIVCALIGFVATALSFFIPKNSVK